MRPYMRKGRLMTVLPDTANVLAPKNPADRLSRFTIGWLVWVAVFAVLEGVAIRQDHLHQDRTKRTLSSNMRALFATDSVTGVPLNVRYGKLRRFALITALGWFSSHIQRTKFV
jgi:hypothetical protein